MVFPALGILKLLGKSANCKWGFSMKAIKELTVDQMTRRVIRYIPELSYEFVFSCIRTSPERGMTVLSVSGWLEYFDSCLIDNQKEVNLC